MCCSGTKYLVLFLRFGKMKKVILLVLFTTLFMVQAVQASVIYATESARTELHNGTESRADDSRDDSNKLSVRGDAKANKSWIKFDISNLDVSSLVSAQLRVTLYQDKSSSCKLSAVNDDYLTNIDWTKGDITWNNAPGNITSADGINPDNASFTTDDLQDNLDPAATTMIGTIDYTDGVAGDQFFMDVLSILQADTDGIVQFALHGAGGYSNFTTHDSAEGDAYWPALVVEVPEPMTLSLLGLGSLAALRKRR